MGGVLHLGVGSYTPTPVCFPRVRKIVGNGVVKIWDGESIGGFVSRVISLFRKILFIVYSNDFNT